MRVCVCVCVCMCVLFLHSYNQCWNYQPQEAETPATSGGFLSLLPPNVQCSRSMKPSEILFQQTSTPTSKQIICLYHLLLLVVEVNATMYYVVASSFILLYVVVFMMLYNYFVPVIVLTMHTYIIHIYITVGLLYYGHFGTLILVLITEVSSI